MRIPRNEHVSSDITAAGPERKCILSGAHGVRANLIRLAVSPARDDGSCEVLPDILARAPGRGAWIGIDRATLEKALAKGQLKGALARAFGKSLGGAQLSIPADLGERIETALRRSLADRLGLELKAGRLLMGSDRIAEHARSGRVAWLGHASDASEDGSRKLDQAWRVGQDAEGSGMQGLRLPLDRAALSVALGRDNVVHLALTDSAAAGRVEALLQRLLHFLGQVPGAQAEETGTELGKRAAPTAPPAVTTH